MKFSTKNFFSKYDQIRRKLFFVQCIHQIQYFLLNQLQENLQSIRNLKKNSRLIKTDFSRAKIGGLLLQYNQMNLQ